MKKEIGSNFWDYNDELNKQETWSPIQNFYKEYFFISGRNAIFTLCNNLKTDNKIVLLPAFTCETVIEPFKIAGWKVFFYSLNKDLTIPSEELKIQIDIIKPSLILFHSYFGFNTCKDIEYLMDSIRKKNITIIEDITQNLFSDIKRLNANYYVASLRKWFAIPDGGSIIVLNQKDDIDFEYSNKENIIYKIALNAFEHKKEYMYDDKSNINKDIFMNEYQKVKEMISEEYEIMPISEISNRIFNNIDKKELTNKRKENYKTLLTGLRKYENDNDIEIIFKELKDNEVPLYFPIYIKENREEFQKHMAQNCIYCPIIWEKPKYVDSIQNKTVEFIYEHIISIPCDQRYDKNDMQRIVNTIAEFFKK